MTTVFSRPHSVSVNRGALAGARWLGLALLPAAALAGEPIGASLQFDGFESDATILADRAELEAASLEALRSLLGDAGDDIEVTITYIGRGRTATDPVADPEPDLPGPTPVPADIDGFAAFNPRSGNEFRIEIARPDLETIGVHTARAGLDQPAGAAGQAPPIEDPDSPIPQRAADGVAKAWSNNSDDRVRLSSLSEATTAWPWRAIVEHSNRCSGTLIGPRHVVTAGHCIYSRTTNTWVNAFTVTPGRAGGNWAYGNAVMPSGSFSWYFTPWQWRAASPAGGTRQYDFGVMVLPERLGDASGWLGFGWLSDASLQSSLIYNRGFPWCNATPNGVARIDDPGDDPASGLVCNDRHLYGDPTSCSIGEFANPDAQNSRRLLNHSCDASAGQSGSPLYRVGSGGPHVIGVHTFSACGKTATDVSCTAADERPLTATRITPEYRDWISYFRSWKP